MIDLNIMIGPGDAIGDRCKGERGKIQTNVSLYRRVTLEGGVLCAPSAGCRNVTKPRAGRPDRQGLGDQLLSG